MAGRHASQAVTRYPGLQISTSSLGMQIPMGWGTFRCRCNLVDYFNFVATAQKAKASGGKGGGDSHPESVPEAPVDEGEIPF